MSILQDQSYQKRCLNISKKFGTEFAFGNITKIEVKEDLKYVTAGSTVYIAKTVIVATGSEHRNLNVPGEEEFSGKGVATVLFVMELSLEIKK